MLGAHSLIALFLAAVDAPTAPTIPTWIYILGAMFGGGVLTVAATAYRNWRNAPTDDRMRITNTLRNEVGGMKELLEEYRIEQKAGERQLRDYREQLTELTGNLARALQRIETLEGLLDSAKERRDEMEKELRALQDDCTLWRDQRDHLERQSIVLRERLRQLGRVTGESIEDDEPGSGGGSIAP